MRAKKQRGNTKRKRIEILPFRNENRATLLLLSVMGRSWLTAMVGSRFRLRHLPGETAGEACGRNLRNSDTSLMAGQSEPVNLPCADTIALRMAIGPIQLLKQATPGQRRTLFAAALGWMLAAFDAMLYALVLAYVMRDLGMSKATSGLLYTLTLLASGIGGLLFGWLADRIGRKRALMLSIRSEE